MWQAIWCAFKCIWEWKMVPCGHSPHSIVLKLWWTLCTWSFLSSRLGNRTRQTGQSNDCSVDLRLSGPKTIKNNLVESNLVIMNARWIKCEPFSYDQFGGFLCMISGGWAVHADHESYVNFCASDRKVLVCGQNPLQQEAAGGHLWDQQGSL